VLTKIREHVEQRVPHLSRGLELVAVPAIGPERTAATEKAVHVKRNADGNAADSAGQGSLVARFDDEVNVVPLHRKMEDPEALRVALGGA